MVPRTHHNLPMTAVMMWKTEETQVPCRCSSSSFSGISVACRSMRRRRLLLSVCMPPSQGSVVCSPSTSNDLVWAPAANGDSGAAGLAEPSSKSTGDIVGGLMEEGSCTPAAAAAVGAAVGQAVGCGLCAGLAGYLHKHAHKLAGAAMKVGLVT